jgi:hypothetical protein
MLDRQAMFNELVQLISEGKNVSLWLRSSRIIEGVGSISQSTDCADGTVIVGTNGAAGGWNFRLRLDEVEAVRHS